MAKRNLTQLAYDALTLEGGLFNAEWLAKVAHLAGPSQKPEDYGTPDGLNLRDEIARAWRISQALWIKFHPSVVSGTASGATAATEKFVAALLEQAFGYAGLARQPAPRVLGERSYPISYRLNHLPVLVAAHVEPLDEGQPRFGESGRKRSPFGLIQEYLNAADDALWGLVTNGLKLRLVRDNASLTRPAWLEADLERIFAEERFADFSALWLTIHASRFGKPDIAPTECALEAWRNAGQQTGTRAREELRRGVERALLALGQGFLSEHSNTALRAAIVDGSVTPPVYFQQLLRMVYRIIFLLTVEERVVLHPPGSTSQAQQLYDRGYSLRRLRERAVRHSAHDTHRDLYASLKVTFRCLAQGDARLGLPALGGLFGVDQTPLLDTAQLQNRHLLAAIWALAWIARDGATERVNWHDMGPEELGSVYESLLELVPQVSEGAYGFQFAGGDETRGNARKLSGSYYTPDSLVQALLDSALEPVIAAKRAERPDDEAAAILSISVIDPAVGSGHFLLAAARRLAAHLARVRAQGQPSAAEHRRALRDVVSRCLFGVDRNPMALELARIALWLEAMTPEAPLSFLDTHLVLGDALLGVLDPACLAQGIPDDAYKPLTGDDKDTCARLKKRNKDARKTLEKLAGKGGQQMLGFATQTAAAALSKLDALPDDSLDAIAAKRAAYAELHAQQQQSGLAEDLLLAAYLMPKLKDNEICVPTSEHLMRVLTGQPLEPAVANTAHAVARAHTVFHWRDAFAQVFARGGFDCVLGNPPWEQLQLNEEEFFASRAPSVAALAGSKRKTAIEKLASTSPQVFAEYQLTKRQYEASTGYARESPRYRLTAVGKLNTYPLFSETALYLKATNGRAGVVVPGGVATDDSTKSFFSHLVDGKLASLFDFENKAGLFPAVDSRMKFCLLTIGQNDQADLAFFLTKPEQIKDERRRFSLSPAEFALFNPNSRTSPVFRSRQDAELTKRIYTSVPVLCEENKVGGNPWALELRQGLLNMTSDSELFRTVEYRHELTDPVPLYEAKFTDQFDHRRGSYKDRGESRGYRVLPETSISEYQNPQYVVTPFYWADRSLISDRVPPTWKYRWFLGFKDLTSVTNERTVFASIIPCTVVGNTFSLIFLGNGSVDAPLLIGALNSIVLDYAARQKVGGLHLNFGYIRQLPIPAPTSFSAYDKAYIVPRVLELTYTALDLKSFYDDVISIDPAYDCRSGPERGSPFIWDVDRRACLRAELDAYYAKHYGLTRDELRYILEPADVMGADYPSETFRVLKDKEMRQFGEYRTRRLVMGAWDALEQQKPASVPAIKSVRRTKPHPVYDPTKTPTSLAEDWLAGLVCDVIDYAGSVDDRTLRLILSMPLPSSATTYRAEFMEWTRPMQANRLPPVLAWLRALLGVQTPGNLSITGSAQLKEVLGDHRTAEMAHALVDAYREQQSRLASVLTDTEPGTGSDAGSEKIKRA